VGLLPLEISLPKASEVDHEVPKPAQVITSPIIKITKSDLQNNLTLSNGMEFMRVPAGKFLMGSNDGRDEEKPRHTVELSEYFIGKYPVTNLEYQAFVRDAKYKAPEKWVGDRFPAKKGNHPVMDISWYDANTYCQWLNNVFKSETPSGLILRLPTEAEWEKAARGTDGREYPWGNQFDKNKCNSEEGRKDSTTPVGYYSPYGDSPYGCADMAGNVSEWCNDWFNDTYYQSSPLSNPLGPNSGKRRVLRGGSWVFSDSDARSAARFKTTASNTGNLCFGFRCACSLP
jgi:formylglycine-generating enzyme required for sulfatase activity